MSLKITIQRLDAAFKGGPIMKIVKRSNLHPAIDLGDHCLNVPLRCLAQARRWLRKTNRQDVDEKWAWEVGRELERLRRGGGRELESAGRKGRVPAANAEGAETQTVVEEERAREEDTELTVDPQVRKRKRNQRERGGGEREKQMEDVTAGERAIGK